MEAAEIDSGVQALKQRLTVSYADYRELEKTWMAARAVVGRWLAGLGCWQTNAKSGAAAVGKQECVVQHHCTQHADSDPAVCVDASIVQNPQAESLEAERDDLLQKVEGYEEARQVGVVPQCFAAAVCCPPR